MDNHAGKDLPLRERQLKLKNNLCGVAFVVVFNRDRIECKAFGKTVSQQDKGKLLDFRERRIDFQTIPI